MSMELIKIFALFFAVAPFAMLANQVARRYAFDESEKEHKALVWLGVAYGLVVMQCAFFALHLLIVFL